MQKTGNRFKLQVKASRIDGLGAYALERIPARRKIGELLGEIIPIKKAHRLAERHKRVAIVDLDDQVALNAMNTEGQMKYINHSCQPNTYLRVFGHHVEFYALRDIKQGEELTVVMAQPIMMENYLVDVVHLIVRVFYNPNTQDSYFQFLFLPAEIQLRACSSLR